MKIEQLSEKSRKTVIALAQKNGCTPEKILQILTAPFFKEGVTCHRLNLSKPQS